MPDEPEVFGLLALMLLHDSRRAARVRDGELVLLADQDRSLWDARADRRRRAALERARALRGGAAAGRTCCRPQIAALHADEQQRLAADRRALRRARARSPARPSSS